MTTEENQMPNENQKDKPTVYEVGGVELEYKMNISATGSIEDPLIIFIGGKTGNTPHDSRYDFLAENLANKGFNCARTQYRRDVSDRSEMTQERDFEDINSFIELLKSQGYNTDNITFIGKSIGSIPLLTKKIDGNKRMVLLAPTLILEEGNRNDPMKRTWQERASLGAETIKSDPAVLENIKGSTESVLILHGNLDNFSLDNSKNLVNSLNEIGIAAEFDLRSGADHHFERPEDLDYLVTRISDFAKK